MNTLKEIGKVLEERGLTFAIGTTTIRQGTYWCWEVWPHKGSNLTDTFEEAIQELHDWVFADSCDQALKALEKKPWSTLKDKWFRSDKTVHDWVKPEYRYSNGNSCGANWGPLGPRGKN